VPSSRHGDDGGLGGGVRHGDDGGHGGADGDRGVEHHAGGLGLGHIATGDAESGQLSSAQSGDQLTNPTKHRDFFGRDIPLFSPSLELCILESFDSIFFNLRGMSGWWFQPP